MLRITKIKAAELEFLIFIIERYLEIAQVFLNEEIPGSYKYFDVKLNQSIAIHLLHRMSKMKLKLVPPSHYKMTLPQHEGIVLLNAIMLEDRLQHNTAFELMIQEKYKEQLTKQLL